MRKEWRIGASPVRRTVLALSLAGVVAGCAGEVSEPGLNEGDLAAALDNLSTAAANRGDSDARDAFGEAARAVRLGVRRTPIPVRVGDVTERYWALVHVVSYPGPTVEPVRVRTLVAYRGDTRPERILYLATLADEVTLGRPSAGVIDRRLAARELGWASWHDLVNQEGWVAVGGKAGIKQTGVGGPCPKPVVGGSCTTGVFAVFLQGGFRRIRPGGQDDGARLLEIATRAAEVNGVILSGRDR